MKLEGNLNDFSGVENKKEEDQMKRLKFVLTTLALAIFTMLGSGLAFAEIEKAVIKIEGGMQCSL